MEDAIDASVRRALAHAIDGFPEHRFDSRASAISITEIVGCFPEEAMLACSLALAERLPYNRAFPTHVLRYGIAVFKGK
jgi:hypothetical protein